MEGELETTRKLQDMLLPKPAELENFAHLDITAAMVPADEVGGDYYDVLVQGTQQVTSYRIQQEMQGAQYFNAQKDTSKHQPTPTTPDTCADRLFVGIGDATGHGLESGMIMLMTQMGIRALLDAGIDNIQNILASLNQSLYSNVLRMNANRTLTLGLVDYTYNPRTQMGDIGYCGQHESVIVIRQDSRVEEHSTMDLGFPVALEADIRPWLNTLHLTLATGDGLVLYTDGITEAENPAGELYGKTRMITCLTRAWHKPVDAIKRALLDDVTAFADGQAFDDDVTLLILKQK